MKFHEVHGRLTARICFLVAEGSLCATLAKRWNMIPGCRGSACTCSGSIAEITALVYHVLECAPWLQCARVSVFYQMLEKLPGCSENAYAGVAN